MTGNDFQEQASIPASKTNLDDLLSFLGLQTPEGLTVAEYTAADDKAALIMAALGIAGEAGEVADLVKKVVFHKHSAGDKINKELGDVMWYVARIATAAKIDLNEVMQGNIDKLAARYPDGFSHAASINRSK